MLSLSLYARIFTSAHTRRGKLNHSRHDKHLRSTNKTPNPANFEAVTPYTIPNTITTPDSSSLLTQLLTPTAG